MKKITAYRIYSKIHGIDDVWTVDRDMAQVDPYGDRVCQRYELTVPEGYSVCETRMGDMALYDPYGNCTGIVATKRYAGSTDVRKCELVSVEEWTTVDAELMED